MPTGLRSELIGVAEDATDDPSEIVTALLDAAFAMAVVLAGTEDAPSMMHEMLADITRQTAN